MVDVAHDMPEDVKLYEGDEELLRSDAAVDKCTMLPGAGGRVESNQRVRILWGQDMLRDVLDGRYRAVICGVNDRDNARGIISQLCSLVPSSQWREQSVTSYARMFQQSVSVHASEDREPYVLKYDLDSVLILALLRPTGRNHFTLPDLARGFETVVSMLQGRRERRPVASVSFLGARSNRLVGPDGKEPSFETVLDTMFKAGYRGDIYPAPQMWSKGDIGVFPSYPFPEGVLTMREGSS
jgi:hypothetical protein